MVIKGKELAEKIELDESRMRKKQKRKTSGEVTGDFGLTGTENLKGFIDWI